MSRTRTVLYGHFGSGNIGNDSSFEAAFVSIRRRVGSETLVCVCDGPEVVARRFDVATVPIKPDRAAGSSASRSWVARLGRKVLRLGAELKSLVSLIRWFRSVKVFAIVGTGAVDDLAVSRPWDAPLDLLRWCLAAKLGGAKVAFLSVGVGPIVHPTSRRLMLTALRLADYRSYREQAAVNYLKEHGFDTSRDALYPDLVFSLDMNGRRAQALQGSEARPCVGLGVMAYRGWRAEAGSGDEIFRVYVDKLKKLLLWLLEGGRTVRILVGDQGDEPCVAALLEFVDSFGDRWKGAVVAERITDVDSLLAEISRVDIVVATRFHNVLCSTMLGKPVVSIGYHSKNDELMASMGLGAYCQRLEALDVELLQQQFEACWGRRNEISQQIHARLDDLRARLDEQYEKVFGPAVARGQA